jgi:hypothetical protein
VHAHPRVGAAARPRVDLLDLDVGRRVEDLAQSHHHGGRHRPGRAAPARLAHRPGDGLVGGRVDAGQGLVVVDVLELVIVVDDAHANE